MTIILDPWDFASQIRVPSPLSLFLFLENGDQIFLFLKICQFDKRPSSRYRAIYFREILFSSFNFFFFLQSVKVEIKESKETGFFLNSFGVKKFSVLFKILPSLIFLPHASTSDS